MIAVLDAWLALVQVSAELKQIVIGKTYFLSQKNFVEFLLVADLETAHSVDFDFVCDLKIDIDFVCHLTVDFDFVYYLKIDIDSVGYMKVDIDFVCYWKVDIDFVCYLKNSVVLLELLLQN